MTETAARPKDAHVWARDPFDFYTEPAWAVDLLLDAEKYLGKVWDPACGNGTIGRAFARRNHPIHSTDLANDRPYGLGGFDFLGWTPEDWTAAHIVCNPPFSLTEDFIRRALTIATKSAAFLVPLKWLASETRQQFFDEVGRPARVYVLANRASMPPGRLLDPETGLYAADDPDGKFKAGQAPGGGSIDYCWVVFVPGYGGPTDLRWLRRPGGVAKPYAGKPRKSAPERALRRNG